MTELVHQVPFPVLNYLLIKYFHSLATPFSYVTIKIHISPLLISSPQISISLHSIGMSLVWRWPHKYIAVGGQVASPRICFAWSCSKTIRKIKGFVPWGLNQYIGLFLYWGEIYKKRPMYWSMWGPRYVVPWYVFCLEVTAWPDRLGLAMTPCDGIPWLYQIIDGSAELSERCSSC